MIAAAALIIFMSILAYGRYKWKSTGENFSLVDVLFYFSKMELGEETQKKKKEKRNRW